MDWFYPSIDEHLLFDQPAFGCRFLGLLVVSQDGMTMESWLCVKEHYGLEVVAKEVGLDVKHPDVERVYLALYKNFVEAIDAIDNGINQYDITDPPRYIDNTNLPARVGKLNPDWMDEQLAGKEDAAFICAMNLAGGEFLEALRYLTRSWLPARAIVADCLSARFKIDTSGEIMVLKQFCPVRLRFFTCMWTLHLFELEGELKRDPLVKYVLYQDDRSKQWRVQAVAVGPERFESRKPLPVSWRGLRDDELSKENGIENCVFVHMSGFVGGNKTFDGALAMAKKALKLS